MSGTQSSPEQVALQHLLDSAYEEFQQSLHSGAARFVLWASFKDSVALQRHYFEAKDKKHLLDGRRSPKNLTAQEAELKDFVEGAASEAEQYVAWARSLHGQPILREMLVSYCSAFECCLKNLALVLRIAKGKKNGLSGQVFVPGDEFRRTLREIQGKWSESGERGRSRAENFFESEIVGNEVSGGRFRFLSMDSPEWLVCRSAFQVRNAVVHQLGRPSEPISIAGEDLHAGWEIQLSSKQLRAVQRAFLGILSPLNPLHYLI